MGNSSFQFYTTQERHKEALTQMALKADNLLGKSDCVFKACDKDPSWVGKIEANGQPYLLKKYRLRTVWMRWKQTLLGSRAQKAYENHLHLQRLAIPTSTPLALLQHKNGCLLGDAVLVCEYLSGPTLAELALQLDSNDKCWVTILKQVAAIITALNANRLIHRDLKYHNFIWHDEQVYLIDLDYLIAYHPLHPRYAYQQRRDRRILLHHFYKHPPLGEMLEALLSGK